MFTKKIVVLLGAFNVVFIDAKPQLGSPPVENIKQRLFNSQSFNDIIQQIWQQVNSQQGQVIEPAQVSQILSPPSSNVFKDTNAIVPFQINSGRYASPESLKTSLFNSDAFNDFVQQIWQQVSSQYLTPPNETITRPPVEPATSPINLQPENEDGIGSKNRFPTVRPVHQQNHQQSAAAQNANYNFATNVVDHINGNYQHRDERRENGVTIGSFSYDDGHIFRTVHYEADHNGFRITKENILPSEISKRALDGTARVSTYRDGESVNYEIRSDNDNRPVDKVLR